MKFVDFLSHYVIANCYAIVSSGWLITSWFRLMTISVIDVTDIDDAIDVDDVVVTCRTWVAGSGARPEISLSSRTPK